MEFKISKRAKGNFYFSLISYILYGEIFTLFLKKNSQ